VTQRLPESSLLANALDCLSAKTWLAGLREIIIDCVALDSTQQVRNIQDADGLQLLASAHNVAMAFPAGQAHRPIWTGNLQELFELVLLFYRHRDLKMVPDGTCIIRLFLEAA
jgi:hypothetical protein